MNLTPQEKTVLKEFRKFSGTNCWITEDPEALNDLESFLLQTYRKGKTETLEAIKEWADNDTSDSMTFFVENPNGPYVDKRQAAVASIKKFIEFKENL